MKFTNETFSILQSFASITPSINIKKELQVIRAMDSNSSILAKAFINEEEELKYDMPIYDIPQFLATINLIGSEYELVQENENYVLIRSDEGGTMRWMYSHPSVINTPDTDINFPEHEVEFELSKEVFKKVLQAAASAMLSHMVVTKGSKDDTVLIKVCVMDGNSSPDMLNEWSIEVPATYLKSVGDFMAVFNINSIAKMMKESYKVELSQKKIARFTHVDEKFNIEYVHAMVIQSVFDGVEE